MSSPPTSFDPLQDPTFALFRTPSSERDDSSLPSVDISETQHSIIIEMDTLGYESDEISICIDGDMITITGEKKSSSQSQHKVKKYFHRERSYAKFFRDFALPEYADYKNASAELRTHTLIIHIPKEENTMQHRIQIPIGTS